MQWKLSGSGDLQRLYRVHHTIGPDAQPGRAQEAREVHDVFGQAAARAA
jgi:hypothetical protein